jgi:transcriptional regulator with XRE-family HTH domain
VSSLVRRRRLAQELRRLREAAHLTCDEVAAALDCSASKISRIETCRVLVSPRDVRDLLRIYGVPEEQRAGLIQLARESRQKGWWQTLANAVEPNVMTYLGLEQEASELRIYNANWMPGLLVTEDYARVAVTAGRAVIGRRRTADDTVGLVMERQRQAGENPRQLWVVLDETVLRRRVGGREVMRRQIEHLIELSSRPDLCLQVMPFIGGLHITLDASFTIMEFPDPADPDIACVNYPTGVLWIEDTAEVGQYNTLFRHFQAASLSPGDSVDLIDSVLKEL